MGAVKQAVVARSKEESLVVPSGILTITSVRVTRVKGALSIDRLPRYHGIPLIAISLLDMANSADFAANVFNEIPVPHFAMALMAIGATFALVMSVVAFVDAQRSWHNIKLLRQEHRDLLNTKGGESESEDEKQMKHIPDPALLSLNRRDLRTEFFERAGMETIMGVAAFLVSVGTYMAIGGADKRVFEASNLLSGYIGNAPTALYGLANTSWSCIAWHRARRQRKCAISTTLPNRVQRALKARTSSIERHAILSGLTCLVSGALGLLTPLYWQPYPVLLVCSIMFIYTTYVFRNRVSYVRPLMSADCKNLIADELTEELDYLLFIQQKIKGEKTFLSTACFGNTFQNSFTINFGYIVSLGLFEHFCEQALNEKKLGTKISDQWTGSTTLTPACFLSLDHYLHPTLNEIAKDCMTKAGPRQISIRIRFLLEALGTCLITSDKSRSDRPAA